MLFLLVCAYASPNVLCLSIRTLPHQYTCHYAPLSHHFVHPYMIVPHWTDCCLTHCLNSLLYYYLIIYVIPINATYMSDVAFAFIHMLTTYCRHYFCVAPMHMLFTIFLSFIDLLSYKYVMSNDCCFTNILPTWIYTIYYYYYYVFSNIITIEIAPLMALSLICIWFNFTNVLTQINPVCLIGSP